MPRVKYNKKSFAAIKRSDNDRTPGEIALVVVPVSILSVSRSVRIVLVASLDFDRNDLFGLDRGMYLENQWFENLDIGKTGEWGEELH